MSFAPEQIHFDTWPKVHALLAPVMERCGTTAAELIDELLAGTAQLWVYRKGGDPIAAAVSELVETHLGLVVHGRLLAKARSARIGGIVDDAVDCVSRHARMVGAVGISIEGRTGWARLLARKGWRCRSVTMHLSLVAEDVA